MIQKLVYDFQTVIPNAHNDQKAENKFLCFPANSGHEKHMIANHVKGKLLSRIFEFQNSCVYIVNDQACPLQHPC